MDFRSRSLRFRDGLCYIAHPNLNGLPASDCLWSVHVAPYVSICRYCPAAAAGCRAGCFDPKASQASLAWLWLPARLSPAAEQQHSALQAEGSDAADVASDRRHWYIDPVPQY